MWIRSNPNPRQKTVPDCVIRAICIALHLPWYDVFDSLSALARAECSVTCDDHVWGLFLYRLGFIPFVLPKICPECMTIREFCKQFSKGTYIIGTGSHAVAVIDGDYYDSWDSGDTVASFFWMISY